MDLIMDLRSLGRAGIHTLAVVPEFRPSPQTFPQQGTKVQESDMPLFKNNLSISSITLELHFLHANICLQHLM